MDNFIESFYFGNIDTQKYTSEYSNVLKKNLNELTEIEKQLEEKLTEEETKRLFQEYVNLYIKFTSASIADGFINGFRNGARFALDTFK